MHWNRIQDVARNITLFFEEDVGSHKKCPSCKGSGLRVSGARQQQSMIPSNEPCWFCEGVGALPIFGLDGFVLARAMSHFQTCDAYLQSHSSLKVELLSGKFLERGCDFKTFKPNGQMAEMVHDLNSIPSWLMCTQERDSCCGSSQGSQSDLDCNSERCLSNSELQSRTNNCEVLKRNVQRFPLLGHVLERKDKHVPLSTPAFNSKNLCLQSDTMSATAASRVRSEAEFPTADGIRFGFSGTDLFSLADLVNSSVGQSETESLQHFVSARHIDIVIGPKPRSPIIFGLRPNTFLSFSSRSRRSSRKERNRIREKAEKDALERARRITKTLNFHEDDSHVVENKGQSEGLQPLSNKRLSELIGSLRGQWTDRAQSIPSFVHSESASVRSLASSGQSWITGLISGRVQALVDVAKSGKP